MRGYPDDIAMRPKAPADHGPLFGRPPAPGAFAGSDYEPARDDARLTGQLERIWHLMKAGGWWTLQEIADATWDPPASVSAQLQHLRQAKFGSHIVAKRLREGSTGLWEYRIADPTRRDHV